MKRFAIPAILVCLGLLAGYGLSSSTSQPKEDRQAFEEARKEFLKEFRRDGLSTTPEDALLLRMLLQARQAKRGIEVGTAYGFGSISMGIGFERTGGHLYTVDIDPRMVQATRQNLQKTGLDKIVTCLEGDALKVLPKLEGEFDFLFLDAHKPDYFKYFKAVESKLKPGAVIVADNAIQSARAMKDFLDFMRTSPDYEMVIVRASDAKKDGMAVCYKVR